MVKIICTKEEKDKIVKSLVVSGYCPFGAVDIYACNKEGCESCVLNRIEWEVANDG